MQDVSLGRALLGPQEPQPIGTAFGRGSPLWCLDASWRVIISQSWGAGGYIWTVCVSEVLCVDEWMCVCGDIYIALWEPNFSCPHKAELSFIKIHECSQMLKMQNGLYFVTYG